MQGPGELVDFIRRRVDIKTSASRRTNAQLLMEWHGAVVSCPDGDAVFVEDFSDIVGMNALNGK